MDMMKIYRIGKLKAMHNMMLLVNDEDYYMTWIAVVPDEPTEEDFEEMAEDTEFYNEAEALFKRLIVKAIKNDEF